jgi:hypothetical protein
MTDHKFQFRFVGTNEWFDSPMQTEESVAFHAMKLHGGRIGICPRRVSPTVSRNNVWRPRVNVRGASWVEIRRTDSEKNVSC